MTLDPEIRRLLREEGGGRPTPWGLLRALRTLRPGERRLRGAEADARRAALLGLQVPDVDLTTLTVPVDGHPDVTVRIHRPPDVGGPLPGILSFFGGAFRQGSNDFATNRWMHARRALDAGVAVIAVDYALAPEHRFPCPIEQGLAALGHLVAHGPELGVDPAALAVGGQSSGAAIAACVAQRNLDGPHHPLALQLLEVPGLDLTGGHADRAVLREQRIPGFLLRREVRGIGRDYLPRGVSAADPAVSPLLREDLRGLPRTVILAAEHDPLRGDAAAYHRRLREAGVPSSATIALGQTHDSAVLVGLLESADHWHRAVVGALRSLHDGNRP